MHKYLALIYEPLMYCIEIYLIVLNVNASIKIQVKF